LSPALQPRRVPTEYQVLQYFVLLMRLGTTIAIAVLLALILVAGVVQVIQILNPPETTGVSLP
jgi:hypothetical protein